MITKGYKTEAQVVYEVSTIENILRCKIMATEIIDALHGAELGRCSSEARTDGASYLSDLR